MSDVGRFRRRARPFDFIAGAPRPGRYPPDDLDIQGSIEAILFAPVEVGVGFDSEGRQVFRQVGILGFSRDDLESISNGTFVHNHPPYLEFGHHDPRYRAGSFSIRDLVFMYEVGLAELIAVTHERTYRVRRRREGFFLDPGQIRIEYLALLGSVTDRLQRDLQRGIISAEEAEAEGPIADEVMERLGDFFVYEWKDWRPDAS